MNAQAPAGWYPDGRGNERYWDGDAWTEDTRPLAPAQSELSVGESEKKTGAFSRLKQVAADKQADRRATKEADARQQAEYVQAAGVVVANGVFGTSTVEIYSGGYVRIAVGNRDAEQPSKIKKRTPYEKLRSITFTRADQPESGGNKSSLGPTAAKLAKGGAGLMRATGPGLIAAGVAHFTTEAGRRAFLTIATDKALHTLTNEASNGFLTLANRGHYGTGEALAEAGRSVLGDPAEPGPGAPASTVADSAAVDAVEAEASAAIPESSAPTLADRLRELAALRDEGVLSEEEFASAKAKILESL